MVLKRKYPLKHNSRNRIKRKIQLRQIIAIGCCKLMQNCIGAPLPLTILL